MRRGRPGFLLKTTRSAPSADDLWSFALRYNKAGQRSRITRADGSRDDLWYDQYGQLQNSIRRNADGRVQPDRRFYFNYNAIGDRLMSYEPAQAPGVPYYALYTPNQLDQYDAIRSWNRTGRRWTRATANPQYDDDGNLTNDGRFAYEWNADNRLVAIQGAMDGQQQRLEFAYDWQGRRIEKKLFRVRGNGSLNLKETARWLFDGWNIVAELDGKKQTLQAYLWGLDMSGSLQGAGGVGGLLAVDMRRERQAGTQRFAAYDFNGNVIGLVNAANGKRSAEYEWTPFGALISSSGPAADANPWRFSTKQAIESGHSLYQMRVYDSATGRWLSRDAIEELGGVNIFAYLSNRLMRVDYLGLYDDMPPDGPWPNPPPPRPTPPPGQGNFISNFAAFLGSMPRPTRYSDAVWNSFFRSKEYVNYIKLLESLAKGAAEKCKDTVFYAPGDSGHMDSALFGATGILSFLESSAAVLEIGGVNYMIRPHTGDVSCNDRACSAVTSFTLQLYDKYTFGEIGNTGNPGNVGPLQIMQWVVEQVNDVTNHPSGGTFDISETRNMSQGFFFFLP